MQIFVDERKLFLDQYYIVSSYQSIICLLYFILLLCNIRFPDQVLLSTISPSPPVSQLNFQHYEYRSSMFNGEIFYLEQIT